ncbi:MAG: UxaA family hydrolase [Deltaproteobacteria bacterium]|nr:MAG: UxaA family hydrolase [Deltaproteobacteria bacterium]
MKFHGYKRLDGKIGVRNHILILPTVACANETCRIIAENLPEAVSLVNQNGCGEVEGNRQITQKVLSGLAANPNVFGSLMIGLGCELNQAEEMSRIIRSKTNKPLEVLLIQEEGGTLNTINKGIRIAQDLIRQASSCQRELFDISHLTIGVECGGSDSTSGLVANPVIGRVSDLLIDLGGTVMFSETTEIVGAEHLLAQRAASPEVSSKIFEIVKRRESHLRSVGEDLRSGQPSPGNKAGGLSTIEEKSLGCIHKGGTKPIMEILDYASNPKTKGLVIMDTPGYDVLSVTAKVAGGCQLIIFTTGRGNPIGNPIAPVLKVTANKDTFNKMKDNIDLDFSEVLEGARSIDEVGDEVLEEIVRIANGKRTKAEVYGFGFTETVMSRICDYV